MKLVSVVYSIAFEQVEYFSYREFRVLRSCLVFPFWEACMVWWWILEGGGCFVLVFVCLFLLVWGGVFCLVWWVFLFVLPFFKLTDVCTLVSMRVTDFH